MRKSFRPMATTAVVITGLVGISSVYAQQQAAPEGMPNSGMQDGMMPMMGMMQQMSEMMSNCNRMMQTIQEREVQPTSAPSPQERKG